ncbi:MAG: 5'/3'-nucleotidase SurE [Synergistetes bacterium]|nr:5'/3'-nucleotidase SurE [Synergistota bacterium]MCX8128217.1 5'/3'-nucleotidase SurE [Synergistota bacterium]MDW8192664.1 5'/3'-nucleotidase SurE [Synergistota bacterium]
MAILLTNDDGIYSEGLIALAKSLKDLDELVIVAPDSERSSIAHAITLRRPLRIQRVSDLISIDGCEEVYACDGTPVDCVILGVSEVLKGKKINAIISGINRGLNLGIDIIYSGTVGAAMEGALLGITSIAVSADSTDPNVFIEAALFVKEFLPRIIEKGLPEHTFLSINYPRNPRGVRFTKQGYRIYSGKVLKYNDPWGKHCYWISGDVIEKLEYESDIWAVSNGYISITPLHIELTNHDCLRSLKEWFV